MLTHSSNDMVFVSRQQKAMVITLCHLSCFNILLSVELELELELDLCARSCATCGQRGNKCSGHFGHVELSLPVYNPLVFT